MNIWNILGESLEFYLVFFHITVAEMSSDKTINETTLLISCICKSCKICCLICSSFGCHVSYRTTKCYYVPAVQPALSRWLPLGTVFNEVEMSTC